MNERDGFVKICRKYFDSFGGAVFLEKRWGGGIYTKSGIADFTGTAWGIPIAIEIKHPGKSESLRADQKLYLARFERAGGMVLAGANSITEIKEFMQRVYHATKFIRWNEIVMK